MTTETAGTHVGKLFICPTPIGNLEDITLRVLRILKEVDVIAAEDTRRTGRLLHHYGINKPLLSYYEHNEIVRSDELIDRLTDGQTIALVSDAGMPGISDPGYVIISGCVEQGIPMEVLPGPSSVLAALVASALPLHSFSYLGFAPRKKHELSRFALRISTAQETTVFFERASRLPSTCKALVGLEPSRRVVVARELTKMHEQVIRTTIGQLDNEITSMVLKGEVVVIVEAQRVSRCDIEIIKKEFVRLITSGLSKTQALKLVVQGSGYSRRDLYEKLIVKRPD